MGQSFLKWREKQKVWTQNLEGKFYQGGNTVFLSLFLLLFLLVLKLSPFYSLQTRVTLLFLK